MAAWLQLPRLTLSLESGITARLISFQVAPVVSETPNAYRLSFRQVIARYFSYKCTSKLATVCRATTPKVTNPIAVHQPNEGGMRSKHCLPSHSKNNDFEMGIRLVPRFTPNPRTLTETIRVTNIAAHRFNWPSVGHQALYQTAASAQCGPRMSYRGVVKSKQLSKPPGMRS